MEHWNTLTQHANALGQSTMGVLGELTKISKSISNFQGEQQKNVIELFKLVADIQNPTIPMDERFKKIHASVDKIHDSYKATQQLVMPVATPEEPPSTTATTGGKRRKTRRNKRNTRNKLYNK
jgi:hypothetical protein